MGEVGPHLLWHERGGPEAADGLLAAGMGPDAPEDALALAVGVAGVHDELHVGAVEQPFQDLVLLGAVTLHLHRSGIMGSCDIDQWPDHCG